MSVFDPIQAAYKILNDYLKKKIDIIEAEKQLHFIEDEIKDKEIIDIIYTMDVTVGLIECGTNEQIMKSLELVDKKVRNLIK